MPLSQQDEFGGFAEKMTVAEFKEKSQCRSRSKMNSEMPQKAFLLHKRSVSMPLSQQDEFGEVGL